MVVFVVVLIEPRMLLGQATRPRSSSPPKSQPATPSPDPRQQRAERERAVALVGDRGREFVETFGEDAVAAIFGCSQSVAFQLVEFHVSGGLAKFPRPRDLLRIIAKPKHGDEVASWAILHAKELADADRFEAYLTDPLPYAFALKKLDDAVAEVRNRRQAAQNYYKALAENQASRSSYGWRMFCLGSGVTVAVVLILRRVRDSGGLSWRWR